MTVVPLSLLESASLLGRYRFVELQLCAALGERAQSCSLPSAVCFLAAASRAHGARAGWLEERLPVSVGLPDAEQLTRTPSDAVELAVETVVSDGEDADVLDGLVGALYPSMAAGYGERLACASPAADPPVVRVLGRLLADLDGLRREGAEVAALLPAPGAGRRRAVEALLARGPGVFGQLRAGVEGSGREVSGPPVPGS